jgi:hypothetical protein
VEKISFVVPDSKENIEALQKIAKATISLVAIGGRLIFRPGDWTFVLGEDNICYYPETDILQLTINLYDNHLLIEVHEPRGFILYADKSLEITRAQKIIYNNQQEALDQEPTLLLE